MRATRSSNGLSRRLRQESGFTIVEMMVALSILAIGLFSLAYTASISFSYSAKARQKLDATAVANQVAEKVKGLALTNLTNGMLPSNLSVGESPNSNISGGKCVATYLPLPCAGENIVSSVNAAGPSPLHPSDLATPLNPHVATYPADPTLKVGVTTFTRKAYLTTVASRPSQFRITVVVSWKAAAGTSYYITDSVIDVSSECPAGEDLHPAAGPCQTLLKGRASVPRANFIVTPNGPIVGFQGFESNGGTRQDSMQLSTAGVEANLSIEQSSLVTGAAQSSGAAKLLDNLASTACGNVKIASRADSTKAYDSQPSSANDTNCSGGLVLKVPTTPAANTTFATLDKNSVDGLAQSISTTTATGTYVCNGQTDSLPCAFGQTRTAGTSVLLLQGYTGTGNQDLGTCPVVQIDSAGSTSAFNSTTYINRDAPTSSVDKVTVTTTRYLPTITIGCIPSNVPRGPSVVVGETDLTNWDANSVREYPGGSKRGYLLRFENWKEVVTTEAGTGTTISSSRTGTIRYWNGTDYVEFAIPKADEKNINKRTLGDLLPVGGPDPDSPIAAVNNTGQHLGGVAGDRTVCASLYPFVPDNPSTTSYEAGTSPAQTTIAFPAATFSRVPASGSPVTSSNAVATTPVLPDVELKIQSSLSSKVCPANAITDIDIVISMQLDTAIASASYDPGA